MSTQAELPRWKCHKEVHAFKITKVVLDVDGSALLHHNELYFLPKKVDAEYVQKHKPKAGGYYVRYADGYESWSPAQAFEEGYTRI